MNHPKFLTLLPVLICLAVLSSCSPAAAPPTATEVPPQAQDQGIVLVTDKNNLFSTAGNCTACHQNTVDKDGNDITNSEYWRGTMMANAMIDPYYLAGVMNEVTAYPEYADVIEDKCNTCHMPMAHFSDAAVGKMGTIFGADGYTNPQNQLHNLARDGVSCTSCHQIQKNNFGEEESFSGGMVYDSKAPVGERELFGPYIPQDSNVQVMASVSGYKPMQGEHLAQSEFCATCHNLYTHYVTADGTLSEDYFPEQTPYTEWLASAFADQKSCQDCHMPVAEGGVAISNLTPDTLRSPYSKHSFSGGNVYMMQVLKTFSKETNSQANAKNYDDTIDRTIDQLQNRTASVEISNLSSQNNELSFDVNLTVLSGHKFPTSYPSRRAWLHVVVKSEDGNIVFDSGDFSDNGSISGNDNDSDGALFEPHYDEISDPEQVQIYEAIMHNVGNEVTTTLLSASSYIKDNRLLPDGFDKASATDDIAPYGNAVADTDFLGGSDTVTYRIPTSGVNGQFTVEVQLLYQSIGYRWAQNSILSNTEEAKVFASYYNAVPNLPELIAGSSITSQ